MNCDPPTDFAVVGGEKFGYSSYSKDFGKIGIAIHSGINKSLSKRVKGRFSISHKLKQEVFFIVNGATLEAKGKSFEGKIVNTVFNDTYKVKPQIGGNIEIEWQLDEATETLLAEGFKITFKTKLDGKDENVTLEFEPKKGEKES